MSTGNGYNPMRWECSKNGCFNTKRRPKIEYFSECFPGKISFGDVDGIVEINSKALMIEWKSDTTELSRGQRIMYERLSRSNQVTVIVLCGDAETMNIQYMGWVFGGEYTQPEPSSLDDAREAIVSWVKWARGEDE